MTTTVDKHALLGLLGVLLTAMAGEFNDQVSSTAIADILGGLHLSNDPGTWIRSLYITGEVFGMVVAPWCSVTFSPRRFILFIIALNFCSTVLVPSTDNLSFIYLLRVIQGISGGLAIPVLMATALRVLSPPIRLYGLAAYALTATFTPAFSTTLAALWVDAVGWQFVFLQAIPFCAVAAAFVWYGMPQDDVHLERLPHADWLGLLFAVIGLGSLSTMLQQGDRLDWFNSPLICVLALLSTVGVPLFLVRQWFHPLPWFKIQLLSRRNLLYGIIALFLFLLIGLSSSQLPITYLQEVQGYRPIQAYPVTLLVAASQMVMLVVMAKVLDYAWVDARWTSFIGLLLILSACIGSAFLDVYWNRDQFYLWQACQAVGQPMVVMSLLLMTTNTIDPKEGPFAAALFNTPRAIAEATGVWLIQLIERWRGGLHTSRLMDQSGQHRFTTLQAPTLLPQHPPPLMPDGTPRIAGALSAFSRAIHTQSVVMTLSDSYLVIAALTVCLMVVLYLIPVRTLPPRIQLAKK